MLKEIIFDFDGTLANTGLIMKDVFNSLAKQYGFLEVKDENVQTIRHMHPYQFIEKLQIPKKEIFNIIKDGRQMAISKVLEAQIFPGVPDMLAELVKEYPLYILTSNLKNAVTGCLEQNRIAGYFRKVYSEFSIIDKWVRFGAIRLSHNCKPEEIMYVGDQVSDVRIQKRLHSPVVAVDYGYNSRKALEEAGAYAIISNPTDIIEIARRINLESRLNMDCSENPMPIGEEYEKAEI